VPAKIIDGKKIAATIRAACILVIAAGKPSLTLPQMVRTGAVAVDVGINRLSDGRLVGDVDFDGVAA
jgi:methylenetetrahydrofolate dehydrogenase (NADP+)/methenyltetrahydrofolate cyclohydrolase